MRLASPVRPRVPIQTRSWNSRRMPRPSLGWALFALAILAARGVAAMPQIEDPAFEQTKPANFRTLSYNIRVDVASDNPAWPERRPHLINQIRFLDPDLLGVQEALPSMVMSLAENLPDHAHYGVGRDDGLAAGETTTLFWRRTRFERLHAETLWCSPTPDRPSRGWDAALPRTITRLVLRDRSDGGLLDVRNTHLDHVGVEAREKCAAYIARLPPAEVAGETARVILMGDFNVGPGSRAYGMVIDAGFRDARTISPVVFGPSGTFNRFDPSDDNDGLAIDHILVGPGLGVLRFAVPTDSFRGKVISDHFPVVADIVRTTP